MQNNTTLRTNLSIQAEINAMHNQCRATLRASNLTRSDYSTALQHTNAAYDLAKEGGLDPQVIASCKRYQAHFIDLIKEEPLSNIERHGHDVYHKSAPSTRNKSRLIESSGNQSTQGVERSASGLRAVLALITTSHGSALAQWDEEGAGRGPTVGFSESLVWMRDEHGNILPPRHVPALRAKRGQSFDGWKNVI